MKLTIIAEGSAKWQHLIERWGLSILVGDDVLFDTFGKPRYLIRQAKKFNVDFNKLKHIIISHDDWDHISGLWYILERNKDVTVYICPHFSQEIKDRIKSYNVKIVEVKDVTEISRNIYSTGEMIGFSDKRVVYEQSLMLQIPKGIVVVTGCAHQGIINIVKEAKSRFRDKIYLLIGGMHLKDFTRKEIDEAVLKLKNCGIENITPMHCTGRYAAYAMKKTFGKNFMPVKEGSSINCA